MRLWTTWVMVLAANDCRSATYEAFTLTLGY